MVFCDGLVYTRWKETIDKLRKQVPLITLTGGETVKELPAIRRIWKKLYQYQIDKGQRVLVIGGGSILDAVGFAAATWKRGIPFVSLPTTLLAQVDAAIGGKVAVNFKKAKNAIGTFAHPEAVWILPEFLRTLPPAQLRAGWVEAYKHALLVGGELWERLQKQSFTALPDPLLLRQIIAVKAHIVEEDPYEERGLRQILNLGHTLGHVWERLSQKAQTPLLHGEAVAIGLIQEALLSHHKGLLPASELDALVEKLRQEGLLLPLPPFTWREWQTALLHDKKIRNGELWIPLMQKIGEPILSRISIGELMKAVKAYKTILQ